MIFHILASSSQYLLLTLFSCSHVVVVCCSAWCKRGGGLDYSAARSMPLNRTVEFCLGRGTKAFLNSGLDDIDASRCFSIMVDKTILNLSCDNEEARDYWLDNFHQVMTAAGKKRIYQNQDELAL